MNTLTQIIQANPFVQGGLTLMIAGWVGYQLRSFPGRVFEVVRKWTTRVIEIRENNPLYEAWLGMLTDGAIRPGGPRTLEVRPTSTEYEERAASSAFSAGSDRFWARTCGKWCHVSIHREESAGHQADLVRRFIIIVEVVCASRADLGNMMAMAKRRANIVEDRQLVDLCDKYGSKNTITMPRRSPDTLCFAKGLYESIEQRVVEFCASREDYERAGIPWRFGLLLHGEPGTGKTSLAHVLASELGRRLAVIPLADLRGDEELVSAFMCVSDQAIVLIEDVDCAFTKRQSEDAKGITFSGFLNCIDGMLAPHDGRVLVMSTNHIDRLDPALIRPGRIDLRVQVPLLDRQTATDYVDRVFAHVANRHDVVEETMQIEHPTPAMLINRIMQEDWRRSGRMDPKNMGHSPRCQVAS